MADDDLRGRVALVTGGSRGIGRSIALALATAGARVAVGFRRGEAEARDVVRSIEAAGGQACAAGADVALPGEVDGMLAAVGRELGPVDVLVCNAGIARAVTLEELDLATWDETVATNLRSAFLLSSAVIPDMRARRWGRLVYLSSTAARVGGIVGPHYAASKAGLEGLMHGYASLLAREGITANAIAPALVATDMTADNPGARPERLPVGRLGDPAEVARVVLAVATNAFITGQTIQVNGGVYMT